jgi:hypothetical protein
MFRRLCGGVKCNVEPPKRNVEPPKRNNAPRERTRINNIKNYLVSFDPNSIKIKNEPGLSGRNKRILTVMMYVNGQKAGNAGIEIGPSNANFNWGETSNRFRGQNIGKILRALLTKAAIRIGKYNKLTHKGVNMGARSKSRPGGNKRPTSTWILQEQLGFRPNPISPMTMSEFRRGNNMSRINKILNNYKKGNIGPRKNR